MKNVEVRPHEGEAYVRFPSMGKSHKLNEVEWTHTKLVLSSRRDLHRSMAIAAGTPTVVGPIFSFSVLLDGGSFADVLPFFMFLAPACIGFALVVTTLVILFQPYHVFTFDAGNDEITLQKSYMLSGLHDVKGHKFSELIAVTTHRHGTYVAKKGYTDLLAIILRFPRNMRIIQTINSVENSQKHAAWVAKTGHSLACKANREKAVDAY